MLGHAGRLPASKAAKRRRPQDLTRPTTSSCSALEAQAPQGTRAGLGGRCRPRPSGAWRSIRDFARAWPGLCRAAYGPAGLDARLRRRRPASRADAARAGRRARPWRTPAAITFEWPLRRRAHYWASRAIMGHAEAEGRHLQALRTERRSSADVLAIYADWARMSFVGEPEAGGRAVRSIAALRLNPLRAGRGRSGDCLARHTSRPGRYARRDCGGRTERARSGSATSADTAMSTGWPRAWRRWGEPKQAATPA